MSFHSTLIPLLIADLKTALTLTTGVYAARRPQKISDSKRDVWIELLERTEEGGGVNGDVIHRYAIHVRKLGNAGGDVGGKAQQDTVEANMRTLVARYNGATPFIATLTDVVAVQAAEGEVDLDPDNHRILDGVVELTLLERE